jgi:methyl-accepting chemotaxis protein
VLNDLKLQDGGYFQGVLPLYGAGQFVGAVAALESTDTVTSNTWQMVQLLGLVYLGCILVIVPCAFAFAGSLTKPLVKIIGILEKTSRKVSSASAQVSSSSTELAEGASQQAAALEETSSSIEEMSSITQNNSDSASLADNLTNDANQVIRKANDSMKLLTTSMGEISMASEETSKIIKTIDEIAFQTNLLALNAAVEAARAGEAGAGFAVVADEVRNLAMRAADAARNTAQLIEDTVKKVKGGTSLVAETATAFNEVSNSSQKIGELTGEISSASKEQAEGIKQINKAVSEMDMVIQRNAASAEESASAAQELTAEAGAMKKVVNELTTMVGGNGFSGGGRRHFRKAGKQIPVSDMQAEKPLSMKRILSEQRKVKKMGSEALSVETEKGGFRDF